MRHECLYYNTHYNIASCIYCYVAASRPLDNGNTTIDLFQLVHNQNKTNYYTLYRSNDWDFLKFGAHVKTHQHYDIATSMIKCTYTHPTMYSSNVLLSRGVGTGPAGLETAWPKFPEPTIKNIIPLLSN